MSVEVHSNEAGQPVVENGHFELEEPSMRPVDIEQDVRDMSRRKRVEVIMNSQVFREELERIIDGQLNEGYLPASLSALQQVTELLLPHNARNSTVNRFGHSAIPVNDIRGVDGFRYGKGEKLVRCRLAAVYRLVDLYGWTVGIYNHITVRISQDQEHFLLNPFGLQYHEITASSLIKVDMQGNLVDPGSTSFGFNKAGYVLHSAIHSARPDIRAIIHIHHPPCVAVSAMKCGLLPISQEAAIIGDISYHDYKGLLVDTKEREIITSNLGSFNKVLILRNHGAVTCGETLEEALFLMHNLIAACEAQIRSIAAGLDNIQLMSQEAIDQARQTIVSGGVGIQGKPEEDKGEKEKSVERPKKWKVWDLEFEAQMRMLDNAGFRTGYLYRQPLLRAEQQRTKYDVEIPPSASCLAQYLEDDKWLSPIKKLVDSRKTQDKMRWVNSPNSYQKVEMLETGTQDPKRITKWVQDGSPSHTTSNSTKIENHQFVPVNVNISGEFKKKQKEMKQIRLDNKISSGPQSNILEGVTWEEVKKMHEEAKSNDQVVMVGAASKGIIQREFQHNAMVYKSAYAKNPFDNITDAELDEYKEYVEKKQRGEPVDDVPEHVRHLLLEPISGELLEGFTSPVDPKSPQSSISDESSRKDKEYIDKKRREPVEEQVRHHLEPIAGEIIPEVTNSLDIKSPQSSISEESSKKEKKKKRIRTPSFLKGKKKV